jgi:hypothetical protein
MKTGLEKNMEEILNLPKSTPSMATVIQGDRVDNIVPMDTNDADIEE